MIQIRFLTLLMSRLHLQIILSRAKVNRHGFMVVSCSKFIEKQKQKKILKLDQICDSMVQTRIFFLKPFGNDN